MWGPKFPKEKPKIKKENLPKTYLMKLEIYLKQNIKRLYYYSNIIKQHKNVVVIL
jgi:hypothetical protein